MVRAPVPDRPNITATRSRGLRSVVHADVLVPTKRGESATMRPFPTGGPRMATRWENGPSVGDTETALGCVRAADTISKLTIAEIVPLTVACFEMASGLVRPASKAQTRESRP